MRGTPEIFRLGTMVLFEFSIMSTCDAIVLLGCFSVGKMIFCANSMIFLHNTYFILFISGSRPGLSRNHKQTHKIPPPKRVSWALAELDTSRIRNECSVVAAVFVVIVVAVFAAGAWNSDELALSSLG